MTNTAPEPEPEHLDGAETAPTNIHVLASPAERDLSSDVDVEDIPPTPKVLPLHTPDRPIQPLPDTDHDIPKKKRPRG